jgi:hypothetical protein
MIIGPYSGLKPHCLLQEKMECSRLSLRISAGSALVMVLTGLGLVEQSNDVAE